MEKIRISEQDLLDSINKALTEMWVHKDSYCRVDSLRKAVSPVCNWEIDTFSTGGTTLAYSSECDEMRKNALIVFFARYDVRWLS